MTFKPPTIEMAKEYADSIGFTTFEPEKWWHHYNSKGWMIGKNKMKVWKSAVQTWFTGSPEWREIQRKKRANQDCTHYYRDTYSDYIKTASTIKLIEMRKAPEWEFLRWLIDELRPEIKRGK